MGNWNQTLCVFSSSVNSFAAHSHHSSLIKRNELIKYGEHNDAIKNKIRYFNWTPHWQSRNKTRKELQNNSNSSKGKKQNEKMVKICTVHVTQIRIFFLIMRWNQNKLRFVYSCSSTTFWMPLTCEQTERAWQNNNNNEQNASKFTNNYGINRNRFQLIFTHKRQRTCPFPISIHSRTIGRKKHQSVCVCVFVKWGKKLVTFWWINVDCTAIQTLLVSPIDISVNCFHTVRHHSQTNAQYNRAAFPLAP